MSGQWGRVELIGARGREEFLPVVEMLDRFDSAPLTGITSDVDLIVVLQSSSDEFSEGTFLELYRRNPLARFVCVYGPWCDGDGRNRDLWPLPVRVPVWRAGVRLEGGASPDLILPLTAGRDETFERDFSVRHCGHSVPKSIRIDSADFAIQEMLRDALDADDQVSEPAWILFDIDPWCDRRREALIQLVGSEPVNVLPIIGFPDPSLLQELRGLGLSRYWAKLAPLTDLKRLMNDAA